MSDLLTRPPQSPDSTTRVRRRRWSSRRHWVTWLAVAVLAICGSITANTVVHANSCGSGKSSPTAAAAAYVDALRAGASDHELCILSAAYLPMTGKDGVLALAQKERAQWASHPGPLIWQADQDLTDSTEDVIVVAFDAKGAHAKVGEILTTCQKKGDPDPTAPCDRWSVSGVPAPVPVALQEPEPLVNR